MQLCKLYAIILLFIHSPFISGFLSQISPKISKTSARIFRAFSTQEKQRMATMLACYQGGYQLTVAGKGVLLAELNCLLIHNNTLLQRKLLIPPVNLLPHNIDRIAGAVNNKQGYYSKAGWFMPITLSQLSEYVQEAEECMHSIMRYHKKLNPDFYLTQEAPILATEPFGMHLPGSLAYEVQYAKVRIGVPGSKEVREAQRKSRTIVPSTISNAALLEALCLRVPAQSGPWVPIIIP